MGSRHLAALCLLVALAGCTIAEPPTDEPDAEELWEQAFVYGEELDGVQGERTSEAVADGETVTETVRLHERPFVDYREEVLAASDPDREGELFVSNASRTWWYDPATEAASYYEPEEPFSSAEVEDARLEQATSQRELVELEYEGTDVVADREVHVLLVEARNESVAEGVGVLVGDTQFVYALETVDPSEELLVAETRLYLDAEYGFPLKEEVVFDVPGEEPYRYTERFETVSFEAVADERFAFEPPANATVEEIE